MKSRFTLPAILLLALVLFVPAYGVTSCIREEGRNELLNGLLEASVMVSVEGASGSGVVFKNGESSYVWSAAHIIEEQVKTQKVIDPKTGQPVVRVTFLDAWVSQDDYENGRKVGVTKRLAKILRYSLKQDLVLMKVYQKNWFKNGIEFSNDIPTAGCKLWHVGSMKGVRGPNSVAEGVFSTAGRLRGVFDYSEVENPMIMDQCSLTAHPGSSGGGVFYQNNGKCIGLLTQFMSNGSYGAVLVVPTRRLREFAKTAQCEWAVDSSIAVPEVDTVPPMQDDIPLPKSGEKE